MLFSAVGSSCWWLTTRHFEEKIDRWAPTSAASAASAMFAPPVGNVVSVTHSPHCLVLVFLLSPSPTFSLSQPGAILYSARPFIVFSLWCICLCLLFCGGLMVMTMVVVQCSPKIAKQRRSCLPCLALSMAMSLLCTVSVTQDEGETHTGVLAAQTTLSLSLSLTLCGNDNGVFWLRQSTPISSLSSGITHHCHHHRHRCLLLL